MDHSTANALPRGPLLVAGISWLLLLGTLLVPSIPLDTRFAMATAYVAESGSLWGFPVVAGLVILLLATRNGLTMNRRLFETLVLAASFGLLFGAGDLFNDFLIKPIMGQPRPFVAALDKDGTLGTSMEVFYEGMSRAERSEHLREVLENPYFTGVKLDPQVRNRWIQSIEYSLPSGGTLGAFALLTFALTSTKVLTSKVRFALASLLVPWAIAVSYARVLLRVYWPYDIISSGMAGILIGLALYSVEYRLLWSKKPEGAKVPEPETTAT